ncbi:hypothetical protein LXL04_005229 [Taraxacum kok-saghyz]
MQNAISWFSFLKEYGTNDWLKMCYTVTHSFRKSEYMLLPHLSLPMLITKLLSVSQLASVLDNVSSLYTSLRHSSYATSRIRDIKLNKNNNKFDHFQMQIFGFLFLPVY